MVSYNFKGQQKSLHRSFLPVRGKKQNCSYQVGQKQASGKITGRQGTHFPENSSKTLLNHPPQPVQTGGLMFSPYFSSRANTPIHGANFLP
jgi:hypothetical protein